MKALVKRRRGDGYVELIDRPEPSTQPGWVTLEVLGAGICGTDLHILHDEHPYWPPVTLGHEFAGSIVELGDGVKDWREGDRVVCEPHAGACGVCRLCRRGYAHLCAEKRSPGWGIDGALARYVTVPAHLLHAVPEEVSDRAAPLSEPTAISLTAIERVGIAPGDRVAVLGPGPIGLITAMACTAVGAERAVVVGRKSSQQRLEVARELELEVWNSDEVSVVERAMEESSGTGFDVVIDTTGAAEAIASGIKSLARTGRLCAVGVSGRSEISVPWDAALFAGLNVVFSFSSAYSSWDAALSLLRSGAVQAEPLVTTFPLNRWEEAFTALEQRDVIKAQILP